MRRKCVMRCRMRHIQVAAIVSSLWRHWKVTRSTRSSVEKVLSVSLSFRAERSGVEAATRPESFRAEAKLSIPLRCLCVLLRDPSTSLGGPEGENACAGKNFASNFPSMIWRNRIWLLCALILSSVLSARAQDTVNSDLVRPSGVNGPVRKTKAVTEKSADDDTESDAPKAKKSKSTHARSHGSRT